MGKGGMGHVYMARHRKMGRIVCLKVLRSSGRKSPEVVERFRREIRTLSSLKHPNFVVAHDASEAGGIQFLVMEYIEGHDLSRQVRDDGPLPVDLALDLMQQVAEGLQYAHEQGVVHRDVKPHNLLVAEDEDGGPQVKVLDLGLARFDTYVAETIDAATHVAMTATGVIMGTVDYMSPEQALNSHYADARSDIYSLGCTLHFLLTGRGVYSGETLMEKLVAHREEPVPDLPVPEITKSTNAVFRKMIAKDPADRYQTMAEAVEDLDACRSGRRPSAMPPVWQSALEYVRENPRQVAAIGVALLLMLGLWSVLPPSTASDSSGTSIINSGAEDSDQAPRGAARPGTAPRNGALPRLVLVAVGPCPDVQECTQVVDALTRKGFQVQVLTSQASKFPKLVADGRKMHTKPLTTFSAGEFYSLAFIDGGESVFTHKNPQLKGFVHKMIHETMNQGGVVVGVHHAQWVLDDAGVSRSKSFDQHGLIVGQPKNTNGMYIRMKEGKHASNLADLLDLDFRRKSGG